MDEINDDGKERLKDWTLALIFLTLGIVIILSFFGLAGKAGKILFSFLRLLFGWLSYASFIFLFYLSWLFIKREKKIPFYKYLAIIILFLSFASIFHLFFVNNETALEEKIGGGYVGYALSFALFSLFGFWASLVILISLVVMSFIFLFDLFKRKVRPKSDSDLGSERVQPKSKEIVISKQTFHLRPFIGTPQGLRPVKFFGKEKFSLDLLEKASGKSESGDIKSNKLIIKKTLESFSIPVEMGEIKVGPTVTQYTLKPAQGIKLSQLTTLSNDLALALAAHPIRIEAPIPGESLVGIEVPNKKQALVRLKEILES